MHALKSIAYIYIAWLYWLHHIHVSHEFNLTQENITVFFWYTAQLSPPYIAHLTWFSSPSIAAIFLFTIFITAYFYTHRCLLLPSRTYHRLLHHVKELHLIAPLYIYISCMHAIWLSSWSIPSLFLFCCHHRKHIYTHHIYRTVKYHSEPYIAQNNQTI